MSDAEAAEPKASAPKSKLVLILLLASVVLIGGGAGAFFLFSGEEKKKEEPKAAKVEQKLPAQFVALEPPFVVNFEPGASSRFLQITVQLMTRDPETVEFLKTYDPIIRNDLLLLFGNKHVEEVATHEGKEALRKAALESVRKVLKAEGAKPTSLEAVYFTSFVMQ